MTDDRETRALEDLLDDFHGAVHEDRYGEARAAILDHVAGLRADRDSYKENYRQQRAISVEQKRRAEKAEAELAKLIGELMS